MLLSRDSLIPHIITNDVVCLEKLRAAAVNARALALGQVRLGIVWHQALLAASVDNALVENLQYVQLDFSNLKFRRVYRHCPHGAHSEEGHCT